MPPAIYAPDGARIHARTGSFGRYDWMVATTGKPHPNPHQRDGRWLPMRVHPRYWITSRRDHGRIHIGTGRGLWQDHRHLPAYRTGLRNFVYETYCGNSVDYPRPLERVDDAPATFRLCDLCLDTQAKRGA